jgi:type II secretory ATPase GspE/PulE/Tfp pilus assembly ATPase PilB-like protein
MLLDKVSSTQIRGYLESKGCVSASQQAIKKVLQGITSLDEAKTVFADSQYNEAV